MAFCFSLLGSRKEAEQIERMETFDASDCKSQLVFPKDCCDIFKLLG